MNLNVTKIIKEHRYETVCVAIALMILLALWPANRLGSQARGRTEEVKGWNDRLKKCMGDPANPRIIQERQKQVELVAAEAKDVADLFESKNRRDFLVPAMFPRQGKPDASSPWQFRTDYNKGIKELLSETLRAGWPKEDESSPAKGKDPSDIQIYCSLEDLNIGDWASASNAPDTEDCWFAQLDLWIKQDLAEVIAELNSNSARQRGQEPSVLNAAVKRIVEIYVAPYYYVGLAKQGTQTAPGAVSYPGAGTVDPMYAPGMPGMGMPGPGGWQPQMPVQQSRTSRSRRLREQKKPFTERFCNDQIDALHFSFSVIVDSRRVNELLAALSRKNLYTILKVSLSRADVDINTREFPKFDSSTQVFNPYSDAKDEGLVYGTDPVVRLDVDVEAIFLKELYAEFMPSDVKKMLSQDSEEAKNQREAIQKERQRAQAATAKSSQPKTKKTKSKK